MLKKIFMLTILGCFTLFNITFASGRNIVDDVEFVVTEVSVRHVDGEWISLFSGAKLIKKGDTFELSKSIDEGLKTGQYDKIKYVFQNDFKLKGRIIIDSGAYAGTYMSGVVSGNIRGFEKDYDAPNWINLKYSNGSDDYGWASVVVTNDSYTTTENTNFTIDENTSRQFSIGFDTKYSWMGKIDFDENNPSDFKVNQTPTSSDEWLGLNGDVITVPFIDPPEVEQI